MESTDASPFVAIVIPCFNYGGYLSDAIESALAQSHPHIEVIVVDDGSTDDTAEVAARYQRQVRYVNQDNAGPVAARLRGLDVSAAPWVVFLDADDCLHPDYVSACHSAVRNAPPDVVFAYTQVQEFGASTGRSWYPRFSSRRLRYDNIVPASALIRADIYRRHAPTTMSLPFWEDYDLYLALAEAGLTGVLVDAPLLRYRTKPGSRQSTQLLESRRKLHESLMQRHPAIFPRHARILVRLRYVMLRSATLDSLLYHATVLWRYEHRGVTIRRLFRSLGRRVTRRGGRR